MNVYLKDFCLVVLEIELRVLGIIDKFFIIELCFRYLKDLEMRRKD